MRTVSLCKPRFARFGIDRLRARFTYEMKNVFNVITVIQYAHHHFRIQPLQKKTLCRICSTNCKQQQRANWTFIQKWWMDLIFLLLLLRILHQIHKPKVFSISFSLNLNKCCTNCVWVSICSLDRYFIHHMMRSISCGEEKNLCRYKPQKEKSIKYFQP